MRRVVYLSAFLLAACAPVGPDFVRPESPVNPAWLEAELDEYAISAPALVDWWQRLNDPVLDELIARSLDNNNNLKIAGLRVLEAQASLNIATGLRYPQGQIAVGDASAIGASESNANTSAGDLSFTQFNVGASVAWEIDFWGRFRRGIEAADASLLATIASYDEAMVLLVAQVATTYAILRSTEEQLKLARESLGIQQRSFEIVEVLFRNGESSELDALQAETLLLSTQASIPNLEIGVQQAKNALSILLGETPSALNNLLTPETDRMVLPEVTAVGIPADLIRQRPDVRRAELQAMAQNAAVGISTANLYPSFSLNGFIGLSASGNTDTTSTGESGIGELFSSDSLTYSVGPAFVWPFLNYGRIENDIRVQDARLQQALIAYRESVLQAAREVEDSMIALAKSREQDEILGATVNVARRSADLSLLRYREGFADYQRVLDSQQSLFSSQQRYAANRGAVMTNYIALFRSLGGGWQSSSSREYVDEATRQQMQERTDWGEMLDSPPPHQE
jgi:NodT family efflux transporter outer membrane factor (OMF) lipoprotein